MRYNFNKGDMVKRINSNCTSLIREGDVVEVMEDVSTDRSYGDIKIKTISGGIKNFNVENFILVKNGKVTKQKPDDHVRYMAYGTGCDNKGQMRMTEKEMKEDLKKHTHDGSWTGKVIGYKLVPLYEAEKNVIFKSMEVKKVTKKTTKKKVTKKK